MYPARPGPPVSVDADQLRAIVEVLNADAVRPAGVEGGVESGETVMVA